ncbi:MAG: hypothetical protein LBD91_08340, partial [Prevotellaceae bacterium]|nr:hypothetical protein [Prevotellaceae bacterium]
LCNDIYNPYIHAFDNLLLCLVSNSWTRCDSNDLSALRKACLYSCVDCVHYFDKYLETERWNSFYCYDRFLIILLCSQLTNYCF